MPCRKHLWQEPGSPMARGGPKRLPRVWGARRNGGVEPTWFKCQNLNLFVTKKERMDSVPREALGRVRGGGPRRRLRRTPKL